MCLHTRLYTRITFCGNPLASVELLALASLDDRLVTAASQCQVDCRPGIVVKLRICLRLCTDTDTDRTGLIIANVDRTNLFENGESRLLQILQMLLFKDKQKLILL